MLSRRRAVCFAALLAAAACGGGDEGDGSADSAVVSAMGGAAEDAPGGPLSLSAADLDAYERGLRREMELVRAAKERAETATTPYDRGQAIQAQWADQTMPEGAQTAGLSLERYRQIRETVGEVLQTLDYQGKINGPLELDLEHATPEERQRLSIDPFAPLPRSAASTLRARLDHLVPVWAEYVRLSAVAG